MLYTACMAHDYNPISLDEAVAAFGTKAELARVLGVTRYSINTFRVRGRFPAKHSLYLKLYHSEKFTKNGRARKRARHV